MRWKTEVITTDGYRNSSAFVCFGLGVSHRQHTRDRITDPFLCSVPGEGNSFHFNTFQIRRDGALGIGCGMWPPAARSVTIRLQ